MFLDRLLDIIWKWAKKSFMAFTFVFKMKGFDKADNSAVM